MAPAVSLFQRGVWPRGVRVVGPAEGIPDVGICAVVCGVRDDDAVALVGGADDEWEVAWGGEVLHAAAVGDYVGGWRFGGREAVGCEGGLEVEGFGVCVGCELGCLVWMALVGCDGVEGYIYVECFEVECHGKGCAVVRKLRVEGNVFWAWRFRHALGKADIFK